MMQHPSPSSDSAHHPRVVIVGAGFGGLAAAQRLAGAGIHVTLVDRRNYHLFQPLLYQVATAALSPADIAVPIRALVPAGRRTGLEVLLEEVCGIDPAQNRILVSDGTAIAYDYLILATGSVYHYFGHDAEWAPFAPSLKSLEDAVEIRRRVLSAFERAETCKDAELRKALLTFVVIGGGPTGVETAGAIAELARASLARDFSHFESGSIRILLLEAGKSLLAGFGERQSRYTVEAMRRMGVEVRLEAPVEHVDVRGVTAAGEKIEAANVLWCAGVKATPVGKWLGAATARNGSVEVGEDMSVPGHPEIFVIGDAACRVGPDGKPYPALAPVAKQQGAHVAEIIARRIGNRPPPRPFRYRDWGSMATIGRSAAVGNFGRLKVRGFFAWMLWGAVHITYLVGFRNRAVVIVNWLWAWATYGKGARLITGGTALPYCDGPRQPAGSPRREKKTADADTASAP